MMRVSRKHICATGFAPAAWAAEKLFLPARATGMLSPAWRSVEIVDRLRAIAGADPDDPPPYPIAIFDQMVKIERVEES